MSAAADIVMPVPQLAHSLRLDFPSRTAPASRSFRATKESCLAAGSASASDPAVVFIRSAVSILSLIRIGPPLRVLSLNGCIPGPLLYSSLL